ncbi:hypothetical protein EVAR_40843_1 [Eumeta japonica]|uniref:Uncharacterized protein n=1 Tax=Eumeta variegata TaxID=151549 RepID=A0A4C1ZVA9_EUMVA|nr:hypothetical protein EVAR_40843_1 [Eumeta japonica]
MIRFAQVTLLKSLHFPEPHVPINDGRQARVGHAPPPAPSSAATGPDPATAVRRHRHRAERIASTPASIAEVAPSASPAHIVTLLGNGCKPPRCSHARTGTSEKCAGADSARPPPPRVCLELRAPPAVVFFSRSSTWRSRVRPCVTDDGVLQDRIVRP